MLQEDAAIGDPLSGEATVPRAKLEEIFGDISSHMLYEHELHGCLNCGICTATCPSAHYYDYSPREIVQLLWTENLEGIWDAMQEKIWACAQCYTCAARCPFQNSPGGLVMIMRETAIKHGMDSAPRSPPQTSIQLQGCGMRACRSWSRPEIPNMTMPRATVTAT